MWIYIKSHRTSYLWSCKSLLVPAGLFHTKGIKVSLLSFSSSSSSCISVGWGNRLPQLCPHIYSLFWRCFGSNSKNYQQQFGIYSKDPWQVDAGWAGWSLCFTTSIQFQYIQTQKSHSKRAPNGDVLYTLTFPFFSPFHYNMQR